MRLSREHEEIFHGARLSVIHAIPAGDPGLPIQLGLGEQAESAEKREARRSDADVLVIGRSAQSEAGGRMRDLTYAMVRDSPCPVASV